MTKDDLYKMAEKWVTNDLAIPPANEQTMIARNLVRARQVAEAVLEDAESELMKEYKICANRCSPDCGGLMSSMVLVKRLKRELCGDEKNVRG